MIRKFETLEYIKDNFTIDSTSYDLISEIIDYFLWDTNAFIKILNNSRIDITIEEMQENNLLNKKKVRC